MGKGSEVSDGWIVGGNAGEGVELGQERATAIDRRLQGGGRDRPGNGDVLARLVQLLFGLFEALGDIGAVRRLLLGRLGKRRAQLVDLTGQFRNLLVECLDVTRIGRRAGRGALAAASSAATRFASSPSSVLTGLAARLATVCFRPSISPARSAVSGDVVCGVEEPGR